MPVFRPNYNVLPTPLPIWLMTAVCFTARNIEFLIDWLIDWLYIVFRPDQVYFLQTLKQRRRIPPLYGCSIAVTAYKLTMHRRNHFRRGVVNLRPMSCCKFWIYWVGVNTKFTTWHICSVLPAFQQGGILIVPYNLLWQKTSGNTVSSDGSPLLVAFHDKPGVLRSKYFVCLFGVIRPTRDFFIYMETSPLPVKGCKFLPLLVNHGHWAVRVL